MDKVFMKQGTTALQMAVRMMRRYLAKHADAVERVEAKDDLNSALTKVEDHTEGSRSPKASRQDARYRAAAKAQYQREGEIEIDDNAVVSYGSDPGAYVQAWVWVGAYEARGAK